MLLIGLLFLGVVLCVEGGDICCCLVFVLYVEGGDFLNNVVHGGILHRFSNLLQHLLLLSVGVVCGGVFYRFCNLL